MSRSPAFRLEPVLRVRRTQERAAALAAAQAARAAADADRRAEAAEAAAATSALPASAGAGAFLAALTLSRVAAEDASAARALATAAAEQADLVRASWTTAAQRAKGLERLRERHVQAVRSADQAAEERTVDDLVTGRAGRPGPAAWAPGPGVGGHVADPARAGRGEVPWTD
jgi:flagellar protein FliJ